MIDHLSFVCCIVDTIGATYFFFAIKNNIQITMASNKIKDDNISFSPMTLSSSQYFFFDRNFSIQIIRDQNENKRKTNDNCHQIYLPIITEWWKLNLPTQVQNHFSQCCYDGEKKMGKLTKISFIRSILFFFWFYSLPDIHKKFIKNTNKL